MTAPAKLCLMCGGPIRARIRRICFDCKEPIGRKEKWRLVELYGITTFIHRKCATAAGKPD